jgi:hypothetical protein
MKKGVKNCEVMMRVMIQVEGRLKVVGVQQLSSPCMTASSAEKPVTFRPCIFRRARTSEGAVGARFLPEE